MTATLDFYGVDDVEQAARLALLAQAAAGHWDGGFTDLRLVKYRENAVFSAHCPDGRRVAVRVHRPGYHSDAALSSELYWMRAIGTHGAVIVPGVLPAANGELFVPVRHDAVPEPRRVSVLTWLTGVPVGTSEHGVPLSRDALVRLYHDAGALAARLHNVTQMIDMPTGFTRHAWDEDGLVGARPLWGRFWDYPDLTDAQRDLLLCAKASSRADLVAFGKSTADYGLIHADFVPENLIHEDGVLKLIDFDDAGFGWHLFELATALYFNVGAPHYDDITAALLTGYQSQRTLPEQHRALLPLFLFLRGTTYLGWVQSRPETETANTLGPMLVERACAMAESYLARRGPEATSELLK